MKCGSTRPVTILRSASTKRLSIFTEVPLLVVPTKTWSSFFFAKWLEILIFFRIQSSPMSCLSSSPSLGLWSPVAIKISIFSLGIPLCRRIDTIFGSINWFGTGRVMSQMRMHALRQDFALSEIGVIFTGFSSARWIAYLGSFSTGIVRFLTMV